MEMNVTSSSIIRIIRIRPILIRTNFNKAEKSCSWVIRQSVLSRLYIFYSIIFWTSKSPTRFPYRLLLRKISENLTIVKIRSSLGFNWEYKTHELDTNWSYRCHLVGWYGRKGFYREWLPVSVARVALIFHRASTAVGRRENWICALTPPAQSSLLLARQAWGNFSGPATSAQFHQILLFIIVK